MMSDNEMQLISESVLEPQKGTSFEIKKDQVLRITVVEHSQVVDLVSYSQGDPRQYLSSPRTTDYTNQIYFTSGDGLYSDQSEIMWTILDDSVGMHSFLFAPCDQKMFELTYAVTGPHPNCFDNLAGSLAVYGIQPEQIFIPFNIFLHVRIKESGEIEIKPPLSAAGDYITLKAEMDMIVAVSACSAYKANDYSFGPVRLEVFSRETK